MNAVLVGLLLVGAAADQAAPRRYKIALRVTQTDPAAPRSEQREQVVAEPQVVTPEGRPAYFRIGQVVRSDDLITGPGFRTRRPGFDLQTVVLRAPSGELRLEIAVIGPDEGPAERPLSGWEASDVVRTGAVTQFRPVVGPGGATTKVEVTVVQLPRRW
jgi:hypothetical protein